MVLYTPEERARRDASPWTVVQAVLAPLQFLVFVVSLALLVRYLVSGAGFEAATVSVIVKTLVLFTIMITGSIWEREVFGRYLFARPFFWEDVVSLWVVALHMAYVGSLLTGMLAGRHQIYLALVAYASYVVNASQFVVKLRAARLERNPTVVPLHSVVSGATP